MLFVRGCFGMEEGGVVGWIVSVCIVLWFCSTAYRDFSGYIL